MLAVSFMEVLPAGSNGVKILEAFDGWVVQSGPPWRLGRDTAHHRRRSIDGGHLAAGELRWVSKGKRRKLGGVPHATGGSLYS